MRLEGLAGRGPPDQMRSIRSSASFLWPFGGRIVEDDDHLILPSIREIDGEDRFKVVGLVEDKLFTGVFVWRDDLPRFMSVRRSNTGEERADHSGC